MPLQCPHCHSTIVIDGPPPRDLVCATCGSSIVLESGATTGWLPYDSPRRLGKFELLEHIGTGAFGTVFKARDVELDRKVAIKIPRTAAGTSRAAREDTERFLREARSAAHLKHPGIVALYDAGQSEGDCYLVSEFIQGVTLSQYLSSKRLGFRPAAELIAQVADALHFAHEHGVVHRDVKPSNIMLEMVSREVVSSEEDKQSNRAPLTADYSPKLMDFGLAKRAADEITMTLEGQVLGTPAYMAPEQAKGEVKKVDARSDVYSLGVILYELLTGELPFHGQTRMLLMQVIQDEPRPPRRLNDRISRDLETICLKAMAKAPASRYQTASGFADDLRRWLKGEPIQARPVGQLERAWSWAMRRPAVAALIGLIALVAVVGFPTATWLWQRAETARQRASKLADAEARAIEKLEAIVYRQSIALAERNLTAGDHHGTLQILASCAPHLRGWEWHCLRRLCRPDPQRIFNDHDEPVMHVAFSPHGKHIASAGMDGKVRVRDSTTGESICVFDGHKQTVRTFAYRPDGARIVSATAILAADGKAKGEIKIWDATTGKVFHTFPGDLGVMCVQYSPDGTLLLSVSQQTTSQTSFEVKLWDANTGQLVRSLPSTKGMILRAVFSPDGQIIALAMGGEDSKSVCEAVLIDLHGKVIRKFEGHRWGINQVEFSSDGERLATAGWDGAVRVWHVASAREICRHQHDSQVMSLSFRSDGQQIASGDWNRTIRIWDASTGQVLRSLRGHSEGIRSVSFSPDGRMLATGSFDKTVRIFDLTSQTEPVTLRSHQRFVASLAFSPDGTRLVSFGGEWPQDKPTEMILWNANSSGLIWSQIGQPMQPSQIAFSADGEQIAHVSGQMTAQGEITICSAASGRVIHVVKTPKIATSLVFSRDGKRLVVGGVDKIVRIVDPVSGKVVQEIVRPHGIGRIALMPDGRRLAVCTDALLGGANGVYLYDLQTGVEVRICSEGVDTMAPIALNASGDLLAVGFKDATVRLFDLKTNQEILKLQGHTDTATDICFSPDGNRIATGSNDRTVKLWDAATGDVLLTLRGHSDTVTTVMFSPDGLRLATGSMDRTIRIWNATPE